MVKPNLIQMAIYAVGVIIHTPLVAVSLVPSCNLHLVMCIVGILSLL